MSPGLPGPHSSSDSILAFARELARMALNDDVDLRRVAEARGAR